MAKTIFEQMCGTYTMQGDYCLPDLTLPAEEERQNDIIKFSTTICSLPASSTATLPM